MVNGEIVLPGACYLETIFAFCVHHLKSEIKNLVIEDLEHAETRLTQTTSMLRPTANGRLTGRKIAAGDFV